MMIIDIKFQVRRRRSRAVREERRRGDTLHPRLVFINDDDVDEDSAD